MARTNSKWKTILDGTAITTIAPEGYDVLINGTDKYLNFNTDVGSSGYGIRDNAGTMEFKNGGGAWTSFGSGLVTGLTGTPTEVVYIDNTGSGIGDALFTRDSVTKATQVAAAPDDSSILGSLSVSVTGNTLTWDADTSDTIIAKLEQSDDVLGLGLKGSYNTFTTGVSNLVSMVGTGDLTGLGSYANEGVMLTVNTSTFDRAVLETRYNTDTSAFEIDANANNGTANAHLGLLGSGVILSWNPSGSIVGGFGADSSGAHMTYNDGTATYDSTLFNGVLSFNNTTLGTSLVSFDGATGVYRVGSSSETNMTVSKAGKTVMHNISGVNHGIIAGNTTSLVDNTATSVFEVALPDGGMTGGFFTVTITATDGTDYQTHSDHVTYAAVNKAGVYTTQITASNGDDAIANSAGTLTVTWSILTGTDKITVQVTANSSLTAPAINITGLNIDNNNGHIVTLL